MAINGFFKDLFSGLNGAAPNPELDAAVEHVVQAVEPNLKFAGGYPQRYRKAVAHALAYARELAQRLPGPVAVSREAYTKDPYIRAIFASPDEFRSALCNSRAMHDYLKSEGCSVGSPLYAVLGMRRREKAVIGMEVVGDHVRHDVAQTAVSFSSHTLSNIAHSEAASRELLTWGFIDSLLGHINDHIEQLKQAKRECDWRCSELTGRLHTADAPQREQLQRELVASQADLRAATDKLDLRHYPDYIDAVLLQPQTHLRLERVNLCIDDMGIKCEAGQGREIVCFDLIGRDRRRWCVALLHCQSPDIVPMGERLEQASRWLNI